MPTRRQLIQKIELNSDQSIVTFSGIPQNYTDLKIVWSGRSDRAGAYEDTTNIRFNGDSGANYSHRMMYQYNGSVVSENGTSQTGSKNTSTLVATSSTASTFGNAEAYIPNYTSSNAKSMSSRGNSENNGTQSIVGVNSTLWNSSSAIASIVMTPWFGTNFTAGSTFYLYGITHVPIIRGGEEYVLDGFKYHKFTSTAALQVIEPGDVECLVVAGGAGGGVAGGGAGGTRLVRTRLQRTAQNYTVTIGSGGAADTSGNNTTIASGGTAYLSATGGGRAAAYENGDPGSSGGSGGGGRANSAAGSGNAGGYTPPEGYSGAGSNSTQSGGGGGGASASGSSGSSSIGGNGGAGLLAFGNYYGGGGGGGGATAGGAGGVGGGGGGAGGSVINGGRSAGLPNTGGGSGGNWTASSTFTGGSGIVIIRYPYDGN